jgi:beta-lactam-binding protein with PASTA domain
LQLGEVSTAYMPGSEPDTVLKQDPAAGSAAARPGVDLLVSEGDPPTYYIMPAVVGLDQPEAQRILTAAGLRVISEAHIAQAGAPKGTVIGQTPPRGSRISSDTLVDLGIAE